MKLSDRDVRMALALAALIVAANAGYVSSKLGFVHDARAVREADHHHYLRMATSPDEPQERPHAFRVAGPTLARGLVAWGLTANQAFYLITQVSLVAFLACIFGFLRARGMSPEVSGLILALMGLTQGAVRWFEYQYWIPDPLGLALLAAAVLAIELDRPWRLAILAGFAAGFVHEGFAVFLPFAFFRTRARHGLKEALVRTAAVGVAFLSVYVTLHAVITPATPGDWWAEAVRSLTFRSRRLLESQWYVLTVGTFGVFLSLAFADVRAFFRRAAANPDLLVLTLAAYASLTVTSQTERPLAWAWPALAAAGAAGFRGLAASVHTPFRSPFQRLAALCLGAQLVHFGLTRWSDLAGSSRYQPANPSVALLMLVLWLVWAATFLRPRPGIPVRP